MAWNTKVDAGYFTMSISPPFEKIAEDLRNLDKDLKNFRTPLRESVRSVMVPSIATNFAVGGRPPWQPLSSETVERRERQGTGSQILVESGALQRAATQQSRWTIGTDEASITNWPSRERLKAGVHDQGATSRSSRGRNKGSASNIPARPFLLIQDEDAERIEGIFGDWIERRARRWWN